MKATGHLGLDEPFAGLFTQGMVVHETYRRADGTLGEPGRGPHRGRRRARARPIDIATGAEVEIGGIEKMSKSKRNTVDPTDIMESYGADTARWFMLSDSPPDRDVIWTEEGVAGAHRFVQRVWRLVGEWRRADAAARRRRRRTTDEPDGAGAPQGRPPGARRRRGEHQRRSASTSPSPRSTSWSTPSPPPSPHAGKDAGAAAARSREALELLVQMMAPMMPHLAEECWAALGHDDLVATRALAGSRPRASGRGHDHPAGPGQRQEARRIDNRRRRVPS